MGQYITSDALPTDAPSTGAVVIELKQLKAAFDAACRELGLGLIGLDVSKREVLVKRAMHIAHTYAARTKKG
jgi:hypothetical protein